MSSSQNTGTSPAQPAAKPVTASPAPTNPGVNPKAATAAPAAGPAAGQATGQAAGAQPAAGGNPAGGQADAQAAALAAKLQAAMAAGNAQASGGQASGGQAAGGQAAGAQAAPGSQVAPQAAAGMPAEYSGPTMREDALLTCLVIVTRIFSNPRSPAAIAHGLPIGEDGLSPDLFLRAADRIGLAANKLKKRLDQVDSMTLPAVLLLKDRKACVLLSVPKDGKVEVATPDTMDGSHTIPVAQLADLYTGQMLVVRPKIRLDTRSSEISEAKPRNWFWGAVMRYTPVYFEVIVAALLVNFFTIATSLFSMQVYDRVVPNKAEDTLLMLAVGVLLVFGFDFALRTLRAYFLDVAGKSLDRKVSSAIFQQILSIRMSAGPQSSGAFASNIQQYETLRDFFTSATLSAIIDLPFVIIFLVIIFVIAGNVAIVPAVLIPVVILVSILVQFPMKKAVERSYRESAQKHATLVEAINGLDMIKATSAEGQLQRDWDGYVAASSESAKTSRFWSTIAVNFVMMSSNLAFVGVILVACYQIFTHDPASDVAPLTTGAMVAASMLTSRAMAPLGQIAGLIVRFHQSWTSLQGLNRMMALPVERPQGKVFLRRPVIEGAIEFRNVSFKYPNAQTNALEGVSFRIQPGERVGIVGRIGSGKTTIERLVLGLFEPTDGAVLIDGVDIRQLDPTDLRQSVGCVLQDPHLFFGSVKDNITLGAPYVDEASVIRAATLSGVDQFVRQHPSGYDMPVGENGRYLSGGQRQSVAVARALLLNPPILLLDEPTSSMDNSTENAFKARLSEITQGKTMLLVTHRNSMLSLVDRLIVLDRGKVVADGPKAGVLDALMKGRIRANEG
ncbi:ATP-binding cassette subfamily C protein LapB [Dongia mobilis]|uniref:ATP-binding cassette subfamily C protein LapB n=1 Tax=Dongia mobilis TaxID=578943 RepID=A0A4R6WRT0_9PROT|nr:type I secretion system permease/ATPase [Dongia mobilis]TDQ81313.1 ATP-binding cassette subfamily C protein LapB [Dongia mobilis]